MQNNKSNHTSPDLGKETENHQIGRELYNRDQQHRQPNQRAQGNDWNNGNNFHTGYSNQSRSHFPEDTHQRTTNADWGGSRDKHYGDREYSTYRNPNNLNYGDGRGHSSRSGLENNQQPGNRSQQNYSGNQYSSNNQHTHFSPYGDGRGNYSARQDSYGQGRGNDRVHSEDQLSRQRRLDDSNENYYRGGYMDSRGVRQELPNPDSNPYNEYPGSRSRFKDDDYRYGSGNHTWYEERRYTANDGRSRDRDKGAILGEMGEGVREAWQDMKQGAQNLWNRSTGNRHDNDQSADRRSGNRHDYEYRDRRDRGNESGPRWSDETDSGDDSFFYSGNRNPRYY
ncbi:hypothetical protein [Rufibacter quisquiliarum]|uniref:Uncharacterized protein n=1 Tax=Rufibacter quisquiliarum TaxID=1549639 RepID=A0A839GU97_9BACT|nr:hypothetical protein [Rufibacter quisquiliarum]MBA9078366.1 hypothetical protein [Rufibacter quisquiliarum]